MRLQKIDDKFILELNADELLSLDAILDNACAFTRDSTTTQRLLELNALVQSHINPNNNN